MRFFTRLVAGFILGCGLSCIGLVRAEPARGGTPVVAAWRLVPMDAQDGGAVCAPTRAALFRTGMPDGGCGSRITEGERGERVALFTCAGLGWGRSVFRSTGAGAMRVETQGMRNGQPFAVDYEARSVAACAPRP